MERWTKEQEQYLIENYQNKMYCDLAKELNKTEGAIRAKCFDLNLVKKSFWTQEEIDFIKFNYQRLSIKQIAQELNRSTNAVRLKAERNGYKKYPYNCQYDFFSKIDTEDKAYWLGFIYADGYVNINKDTNSGHVGIELQASDAEHLKKFNKSVGGNYPITFRDRMCQLQNDEKIHRMCQIIIHSINMANDLIQFGATQDKTYTMQMPRIQDSLMPHFIRGYFDGDGCLCNFKKNDKNKIKCNFYSVSTLFLEQLRAYLYNNGINSYLYTSKKNNGKYKNLYTLEIAGDKYSLLFLNYIYDNASVYLDRKYNKYLLNAQKE